MHVATYYYRIAGKLPGKLNLVVKVKTAKLKSAGILAIIYCEQGQQIYIHQYLIITPGLGPHHQIERLQIIFPAIYGTVII